VKTEDPFSTRAAPTRTADIWDSFTYFVFLDHNRTDAEASYLYDLLKHEGLLEMAKVQHLAGKWSGQVGLVASSKLKGLQPGRKTSVLRDLMTTIADSEQCILEGHRYFRKHGVTGSWITSRTRTKPDVDKLLWEWGWNDYQKNPDHIWRFGLTKGILLLNSIGLALNYCPPSRQVHRFMEEDMGRRPISQPSSGPSSQTSSIWSWSTDFAAIRGVQTVASTISPQTQRATTADVGHSIWYWKSAQGLLAFTRGGLRKKLTPKRFLDFLLARSYNLPDFSEALHDIDVVDQLATDLRSYVAAMP